MEHVKVFNKGRQHNSCIHMLGHLEILVVILAKNEASDAIKEIRQRKQWHINHRDTFQIDYEKSLLEFYPTILWGKYTVPGSTKKRKWTTIEQWWPCVKLSKRYGDKLQKIPSGSITVTWFNHQAEDFCLLTEYKKFKEMTFDQATATYTYTDSDIELLKDSCEKYYQKNKLISLNGIEF